MRKAFTIAVVLLGFASLAAADEWKAYNSASGRYQALFPGAPKEQTQKMDTEIGPIDATITSLETPSAFYAIAYNDYPKDKLGKNADEVLNKARKGAVDKVKGTLVSEKKIEAGGYPGRDLTISAPGDLEIAEHVFLVKTRLYQILVVTPKGKGAPDDIKKFMDSFKFTP
jgi:hypothetical protein